MVFVEVKFRHHAYFNISEVIVPTKQRKIIKTAHLYIAEHHLLQNLVYRFDVALLAADGADYQITYIPNAFTQEQEFCYV